MWNMGVPRRPTLIAAVRLSQDCRPFSLFLNGPSTSVVQAPQLSLDQVLPLCHAVLINVVISLGSEQRRTKLKEFLGIDGGSSLLCTYQAMGHAKHCIMRTDQRASLVKLLDDIC
ncbi:hypothetical protein HZ326_12792 [Fusarium oxysporum f. sp. albedinis]|nr:hypothetical protein HZ326_12792 [Fusarium oxysporum f. sp. albedinis]